MHLDLSKQHLVDLDFRTVGGFLQVRKHYLEGGYLKCTPWEAVPSDSLRPAAVASETYAPVGAEDETCFALVLSEPGKLNDVYLVTWSSEVGGWRQPVLLPQPEADQLRRGQASAQLPNLIATARRQRLGSVTRQLIATIGTLYHLP